MDGLTSSKSYPNSGFVIVEKSNMKLIVETMATIGSLWLRFRFILVLPNFGKETHSY